MKKLLILLLLIVQTMVLRGQDLKTIKKKDNVQEGTATFYVLENNDTIKHGEYQIKAYSGKRILLKGTYINNKKVGQWEEQYYGSNYKGPKATGHYDNDLKTGNWVYFDYSGDTVQIYNWTNNEVVYSKLCGTDIKEYTVIEDGKEYKAKLECPPTCVSGRDYFLYEFSRFIRERADLFNSTGNEMYQLKTRISITIDKNSSVRDISYSTEEKPELKEVIEKFVKSYTWIPGKLDGKEITSKFEFSVNFSAQF